MNTRNDSFYVFFEKTATFLTSTLRKEQKRAASLLRLKRQNRIKFGVPAEVGGSPGLGQRSIASTTGGKASELATRLARQNSNQ